MVGRVFSELMGPDHAPGQSFLESGGPPFFTAEGFTVFFVKGFGAAAAHQFEHLVGHLVGKSKIPGPAIAQSKNPVKSNVFQNLGEKLGDGSGAG